MHMRASRRGQDASAPSADGEEGAARQPLPPLLGFALALWAACASSLSFSRELDAGMCLAIAVVSLAAAAIVVAVLVASRHARCVLALPLLGVLVGLALGAHQAAQLHVHMEGLGDGVAGTYEFLVVEDPRAGDFSTAAIAQTDVAGVGRIRVRLSLERDIQLACWDRFVATCTIGSAGASRMGSLWAKGCAGKASPKSIEVLEPQSLFALIGGLRKAALERFAQHSCNGAMLVESISLGSRQRLFASELYGQVKTVGLAHIVAVSGAHLGILSAFIVVLARALHLGRRPAAVVQLALLAAFVVLAGAPHSALRAALMAACAIGAFFARRRGWALNALGSCIACLILAWPAIALSMSFALSACATLSILLFSRYFAAWFACATGGRMPGLCDLAGMSCAAIVGTAPLAWGMFGQVSLLGAFASILAIPACAILCVGGLISAILCACAPAIAQPFVQIVVEAGEGCCRLIGAGASIPYACIGVPVAPEALALVVVGLLCLLYGLWPRPSMRRAWCALAAGALGLLVVVVVAPALHGNEVIMLDVGQGDAIVLRSGSRTVLVDTGTEDALVVKALARHDIREVDLLVITHPDDDHCGALEAVCGTTVVHQVGLASDLLECSCRNCSKLRAQVSSLPVVALRAGDTVSWGVFSASVIAPDRFREEGGNQDSVVLEVLADCGGGAGAWRLLLTGDAEAPTLEGLAARGRLDRVDILKVGHHGSRASLDERLLEVLSPQMALVSCGKNNRYGHPAPEVIDLLEGQGVHILRTDEQGDVSCYLHPDAIEVRTLR